MSTNTPASPAPPEQAAQPADDHEAFEVVARADTAGVSFDRDGYGYVDMAAALLWRGWQYRSAALAAQPADVAQRLVDLRDVEIAGMASAIGHLAQLVDELRPGHDRYQFLRERDLDTIHEGGIFAGRTPDNVVINGEDLDAAIDAALAAKGGA